MLSKLYKVGNTIYHPDSCQSLLDAVRDGEMGFHALARNNYPGHKLTPDEVPGLCSLGYWYSIKESRRRLLPHRNEGIELTMPFTGSTPIMVEGRKGILNSGEIMITRPWQLHAIGNPTFAPGKLGWIIIDLETRHPHQEWKWPNWITLTSTEIQFLTRALRENEDIVRVVPERLSHYFEQTVRLADHPKATHRSSRLMIAINTLLLELIDFFETTPVVYRPDLTESSRSIQIFLKELEETLSSPWSVITMAEFCGLGLTQFNQQFQRVVGDSPAHYLFKRRMKEATRLLVEEPGKTISEIAKEVGFTYASYFSRIFVEHYGCTAKTWRKRALEKR